MFFGLIKKSTPKFFKYSPSILNYGATGTLKPSTKISGLPVSERPREEALEVYNEILEKLKAIPEDANYRKIMENLAKERIKVIEEFTDVKRIELELGMIQIEEIIEEGRDELDLIPKMIEWKPWEFDGEVEVEIGD